MNKQQRSLVAQDLALAAKITAAVKAADAAEVAATTAREALVSRSKEVGILLLEAKELHPAVKDFEAFLKQVDGLKLSRAYDLLRLAGGRTTDEELKAATRERVKKHRAAKGALPKPDPDLSVTERNVTETPEESAERRKAEYAADEQAEDAAATGLDFDWEKARKLNQAECQIEKLLDGLAPPERVELLVHAINYLKPDARAELIGRIAQDHPRRKVA